MATIKFYSMLKISHFTTHVDTRFLSEFLLKTYSFMLEILGFISKYLNRSNSNFGGNHIQEDDQDVSKNSEVFDGNIAETEDSVFVKSGLISNNSKCQFLCGENLSEYIEEPKTMKFLVHEVFVGLNEVFSSDQSHDSEISRENDVLELKLEENTQEFDEESEISCEKDALEVIFDENIQEFDEESEISREIDVLELKFDENIQDFDEESEIDQGKDVLKLKSDEKLQNCDEKSAFTSFSFNLFNPSCIKDYAIGQESLFSEVEKEKSNSSDSKNFPVEGVDNYVDNEIMDDHDFCYEVELLDAAGNRKIKPSDKGFLEIDDHRTHQLKPEDFDEDEYIEFEPQSVNLSRKGKESSFCGLQEKKNSRDFDYDSEDEDENEDEGDVLSEHQNLVQQMKMELKNCRIGGLPTISEDCETLKMVEDLKPLKIDSKFEYKDVIEEIQKFYKCYTEKMRKLDILNYQTLHAISFLQLKDSDVFTASKKKSASSIHFNLPKIWSCNVQRIYADPTDKSIIEMHRDLELVYVGQLCLSWEILTWLYVKARELLDYDHNGTHSYNRVAEEFQQFQVLMQRFMEDEPFQGRRIENYVKSRCLIRSLLQVPIIKDDCLKDKKETREENDAISLEMLVEIIRESMMIFREFLWADKRSANVVVKGINGTKVDDLHDHADLELLVDIITNLQKKEKRIRDQTRSENCIVKKMKKVRECRLDQEVFTSQVELRLVSRVLGLSRLTMDQLVWCQSKLSNINFVSRRVHLEQSFLLFPC